jgi:hypothetical protein
MRANGRMHKGGLRLLVAAVLASLVVLVIGVPGGGAATDPEVAGITCVLGDVGCFGLGAVWSASVCPYDRANQPVTCSFPAIPRLATGRTRVSTGVSCTFAFPLLPPFPPPGGTDATIWSTDHGTAIISPDGSVVIHCPPA